MPNLLLSVFDLRSQFATSNIAIIQISSILVIRVFQLTKAEWQLLKSQFVTSIYNNKKGGKTKLPFVFTEQGVAMLSGLLNSDIAISVNINIMRAFVQIRKLSVEHKNLQEQIIELKQYFIQYANDTNGELDKINAAIDLLMDRTKPAKIGYKVD